jgi:hypothetical protein
VLQFLARVAELDQELALDLTKRLFENPPDQLPNERTAWRDVLRTFLIRVEGAAADPIVAETCQALAEVTYRWLLQGGNAHGWAGLTQALFRLLALSVKAEKLDPLWVSNVFLQAAQRRTQAVNLVQGARGKSAEEAAQQPGAIAAHADILTGIADLLEAYRLPDDGQPDNSGELDRSSSSTGFDEAQENPDVSIKETLLAVCRQIVDQLPPPKAGDTGGRSLRPAALGKLSHALYRLEAATWRSYAEAALATCQADAMVPDPWIHSIDQGLAWLRSIDDPEIRDQAGRLTRELIADAVPGIDADTLPEDYGEFQARSASAEEIRLASLVKNNNVYERGRIALRLWQEGRATMESLVDALAQPSPSQRPGNHDSEPPKFFDIVIESLIQALVAKPAPRSSELVDKLDALRSPERRESVSLNLSAFSINRWNLLAQAEDFETLHAEVETEYERASRSSDFNSRLSCCHLVTQFDLMLAERWLIELIDDLRDPIDRGLVVVTMLGQLSAHQPGEIDNFGARWLRYLPESNPSPNRISVYQTMFCEHCGRIESFDEQVGKILKEIGDSLPGFYEWLLRDASKDKSRDEAWKNVGDILSSVGQVEAVIGSARERGVAQVANTASDLLDAATAKSEHWERGAIERNLLEGLHIGQGKVEIQKGPITEFIVRVFDDLSGISPLGDLDHVCLGLDLAVQLKQANSSWAEQQAQRALVTWEAELAKQRGSVRDSDDGPFSGLARMLGQVFARDSVFDNPDERRLFDLSKSLAEWCARAPRSSDIFARMQRYLARITDANKRKMISAPLALGALLLGDTERASALIDATDSEYLELAGFYKRLVATVNGLKGTKQADLIAELKPISLKLMLETLPSGKNDALSEVILLWFLLRAAEQPRSEGNTYLLQQATRFLDWDTR